MTMRNIIDRLDGFLGEQDDEEQGQPVPDKDEKKNGGDAKSTIKVLADTDYRDKEAFFKMAQLIKGLAAMADKDETAKKYLSKVSDELTDAAEDILGESYMDEAKGAEVNKLYNKYFEGIQVNIMAISRISRDIEKLIKAGDDIDGGMKALVKKYREN